MKLPNMTKLKDIKGEPMYVNADRVTSVTLDATGTNTVICLDGNVQGFYVKGTPDEVVALIDAAHIIS
jgi:hypothetical protein